jgi:hypothetical protein
MTTTQDDAAMLTAFVDVLKTDAPALATPFQHVVDLRLGTGTLADQYVDFGTNTDGRLSLRLNEYVAGIAVTDLPANWKPLEGIVDRRAGSLAGDSCRAYDSIADLLPALKWYDPARPAVGGWVLAGSAARPSDTHDSYGLQRHVIVTNGLGVCEARQTRHTVYLPSSAGDIDLFLVVGGDDDEVREMVARSHIADILYVNDANPMLGLVSRPVECATCSEPKWGRGGNCDACVRKNPRLDAARKISPCYEYAQKHVIGYSLGGFDVQFITRVYKDVSLIVPRFDMTVDGAIWTPKMGLRVLELAAHEWRNGIVLLSPFSGSSTMGQRVYKKMMRYKHEVVIPGYVDDDLAHGLVFAVAASHALGDGKTRSMREYVQACRSLPREWQSAMAPFWHPVICTPDGFLRRIEKVAWMQRSLESAAAPGDPPGAYTFSETHAFCRAYRVAGHDIIILTDKTAAPGGSGSFQALTMAETVAQLKIGLQPATSAPLQAGVGNSARPDADAVGISARIDGEMTEQVTKRLRRAMAAFRGPSHSAMLSNLVSNRMVLAACPLDTVLVAPGSGPSQFILGLVGDFGISEPGFTGAQLWSVSATHVSRPPVIKCIRPSGLYETNAPVCMGYQSHFHEEEARDSRIQVSLPALIVSLTDRVHALLAGDETHLASVGVLQPIKGLADVVRAHADTLQEMRTMGG